MQISSQTQTQAQRVMSQSVLNEIEKVNDLNQFSILLQGLSNHNNEKQLLLELKNLLKTAVISNKFKNIKQLFHLKYDTMEDILITQRNYPTFNVIFKHSRNRSVIYCFSMLLSNC